MSESRHTCGSIIPHVVFHEHSSRWVMSHTWVSESSHTNQATILSEWVLRDTPTHPAGSLQLQVSFAKEPYKRDDILQKRPIRVSPHISSNTHPLTHVTLMSEWVTPRTWYAHRRMTWKLTHMCNSILCVSHATHIKTSCHASMYSMIYNAAHESCHSYKWVAPHLWIRHVTRRCTGLAPSMSHVTQVSGYRVATINRLLKIISLFCKRAL